MFTWWFAFTRDIRRERTFTTQQIETLRDVYTLPLGPDTATAALEPATGRHAATPETETGTTPAAPQGHANVPSDPVQAAGKPQKTAE